MEFINNGTLLSGSGNNLTLVAGPIGQATPASPIQNQGTVVIAAGACVAMKIGASAL